MTDAMLNEFKCWSRLTWRIYARLPETIYHPRRSLSMVKAKGYNPIATWPNEEQHSGFVLRSPTVQRGVR
jgi:hypothetical protein